MAFFVWVEPVRRVRIPFFFFSSRRRHTRCGCDWSSDVCSSDLICLSAVVPHREIRDNAPRYSGRARVRSELQNACGDWYFYSGTRGRTSPSRRQLISCTQADMQNMCASLVEDDHSG